MIELCTLGHVLQPFFIDALVARGSSMEYLDFSECTTASTEALNRIAASFPKLAGISLSRTPIHNEGLRLLGMRSTSLTMLNICNTVVTLPTLGHLLAHLPHLQKLYLLGCFKDDPGMLDAAVLPPRLALQALCLTLAPRCPDEAVAAILSRSGNLHTLMLSSNPQLTDAALEPVPSCTPCLWFVKNLPSR